MCELCNEEGQATGLNFARKLRSPIGGGDRSDKQTDAKWNAMQISLIIIGLGHQQGVRKRSHPDKEEGDGRR